MTPAQKKEYRDTRNRLNRFHRQMFALNLDPDTVYQEQGGSDFQDCTHAEMMEEYRARTDSSLR